jgi:hypothetical protein
VRQLAWNVLPTLVMKTTTIQVWVSLALVPSFAVTVSPQARAETVEITDDAASAAIAASDVSRRGGVVVGTLVNRGTEEVRDVRLLIDLPFLWTNEVKPGDDSPGRSTIMTVAGPIPPRGQLAFEFTPSPALPERSDGRFADPEVHVLGYESVAAR